MLRNKWIPWHDEGALGGGADDAERGSSLPRVESGAADVERSHAAQIECCSDRARGRLASWLDAAPVRINDMVRHSPHLSEGS
jgi:hypothetical protein